MSAFACEHSKTETIETFDWIRCTKSLADAASVFCKSCGLAFTLNYPTSEKELALLNSDFDVSFEVPQERSVEKAQVIEQLLLSCGVTPPATFVVDFGGGSGRTANELRRRGWTAYSFDPWAQLDSALEMDVFLDREEYLELLERLRRDGVQVVIALFHVLEHIPDPLTFLRELRRQIPEGSYLLCEVPVIELEKTEIWDPSSFFAPFHATHFSIRNLDSVLTAAEFMSVDSFSFPDYNGYLAVRVASRHPLQAIQEEDIESPANDIAQYRAYITRRETAMRWLEKQVKMFQDSTEVIVIWGLGLGFENCFNHFQDVDWRKFLYVDRNPERVDAFSKNWADLPKAFSPSQLKIKLMQLGTKSIGLIPLSYARAKEIEVDFEARILPSGAKLKCLRYPVVRSY